MAPIFQWWSCVMMMRSGPPPIPSTTRVITARGIAPMRGLAPLPPRTPPRPAPRSAPPSARLVSPRSAPPPLPPSLPPSARPPAPPSPVTVLRALPAAPAVPALEHVELVEAELVEPEDEALENEHVDDMENDVIELVSIKTNDAPLARSERAAELPPMPMPMPVPMPMQHDALDDSTPSALSRDLFETNILRRGHVARRVIALGLVVAVVIACPWAASFARGIRAQATPHVATAIAPVLAKTTAPPRIVAPAKTAVAPAKMVAPKKSATKKSATKP